MVELQRHRIRVATRLSLCRDSVVCITATQSRPNNFQLRTELLRCQDRREIQARILAVELSRSCQDADSGRRTTPCKALMSKRRASCIENSAAFSFDERQPAWKTLRVSHFPTARRRLGSWRTETTPQPCCLRHSLELHSPQICRSIGTNRTTQAEVSNLFRLSFPVQVTGRNFQSLSD